MLITTVEFVSGRLVGRQVAGALAAAHAAGIVHRDIKPENVMARPDGLVKVLDFGLARFTERPAASSAADSQAETLSQLSTEPGVVMGTVNYMSPEQARGQKVDHRTDIFSLGVMLYEMVAGRRPFDGETDIDAIAAILRSDPPPVNQLRPGLPSEMERIIGQMPVKDRESRYGSAAELRAELQRLQRRMEAAAPETVGAGEALATESAAPALTTFVGREAEMERLDRLLRQAVDGAGRVVFITGEPGIGKTSLADRFLRDARRSHPSLICGRGQCVEQYGAGEAYLPFLDALGGLLAGPQRERIMGILRTYAPTWCLQFPAVFSGDALEQLRRETIGATKERMLREMGEALGALAPASPGALLLEDLTGPTPPAPIYCATFPSASRDSGCSSSERFGPETWKSVVIRSSHTNWRCSGAISARRLRSGRSDRKTWQVTSTRVLLRMISLIISRR